MRARKIKCNLDTKSIQNTVDELENYKARLISKGEEFIRRLSEVGIEVAQLHVNAYDPEGTGMGSLISFTTKNVSTNETVSIGYMVGENKSKYVSNWKVKDEESGKEVIKSAELNPLMMYEFGSGLYAIGGYKGSFPSTSPDHQEHVDNGWWYKKLNGRWYHSYGLEPTRPMLKAWEEMKKQIYKVAKEVFSEG